MSEKDQDKKVEEETVAEPVAVETTVAEGETVINTEASETTTPKRFGIKNYLWAVLAIVVIGSLLLFGLERQGRIETGVFSFMEKYQAVATVNDVKITRDKYEQNRAQLTQSATAQGVDINDEEIQKEISTQAIDVLINGELLRQEADNLDIEATAEEVETRYNELKDQLGGEEELLARLREVGVTAATLMQDIEDEIRVEKLLEVAIDRSTIEVSDDEIREVYDEAAAVMPSVPSFEEARETIATQLSYTKEQELLRDYIQTLRDNADVEVKI